MDTVSPIRPRASLLPNSRQANFSSQRKPRGAPLSDHVNAHLVHDCREGNRALLTIHRKLAGHSHGMGVGELHTRRPECDGRVRSGAQPMRALYVAISFAIRAPGAVRLHPGVNARILQMFVVYPDRSAALGKRAKN